jgi:hypothetical protein
MRPTDSALLYSGNIEPAIDELLRDPIAHLLMARDGIDASEILAVVERAGAALRSHNLAPGQVL